MIPRGEAQGLRRMSSVRNRVGLVLRGALWRSRQLLRSTHARGARPELPRRRVTLVYLGGNGHVVPSLKLDLARVARRLNRPTWFRRKQISFEFHVHPHGVPLALGREPSARELWEPDYHESKYRIERLLKGLNEHWVPDVGGNDIVVGVMRAPLTMDEKYKDDDSSLLGEDYYSKSDYRRCAVVSTSGAMLANKPRGKTNEQYVGFLIGFELLSILSGEERFHLGHEPCLMNDCADRAQFTESMEHGEFCTHCSENLGAWGVSADQRSSFEAIARWCSRDTWRHSVGQVLRSPLKNIVLIALSQPLVVQTVRSVVSSLISPAVGGWEMGGWSVWDVVPVGLGFFLFVLWERYVTDWRERDA